jgi:hypothetical protein
VLRGEEQGMKDAGTSKEKKQKVEKHHWRTGRKLST